MLKDLLLGLLSRMGFSAEVAVEEASERIYVNIHGEDAGLLIGKKGQTLDALQLLLNKMMYKGNEPSKPIVVDSDGYRQRREDALGQLAIRLREKALETRKIVAVNPMSAQDRRVIHLALKDLSGVTTRSEGDGPERRLLIVPDAD